MWHFRLKCERTGVLVKANHKQLKDVLASGVRSFGSAFVISKLDEFLLFDNFFPDLANFWDLDNFLPFEFFDLNKFWLFNFLDFLIIFSPLPISNLSILLSPIFSHSKINFPNSIIVFSIQMSGAAILLKP